MVAHWTLCVLFAVQRGGRYVADEQQRHNFGAGLAGIDAHMQGDKWRAAFLRVAAAAGILVPQGDEPQPEAVVQAVMNLKRSEEKLQDAVQTLQQHEAALQIQVSHLTLQNLELRRELGSGWAVAEPSVVQVRHLVLDPAIQQEFLRLRRELEEHKMQIQQLQEHNESLTFTAESKVGRQLITKTKMLADENEEMAMQLREGPVATQGALLALERHQASELRKGLSEIKDHCTFLEEENEELNMLRFLNERQIADIKIELANAAEAGRMVEGDRERTDRAGRGMMKRGGPSGGGHNMGRGGGVGGGSYQQGRGVGRGDGYGRRGRGPRGGDVLTQAGPEFEDVFDALREQPLQTYSGGFAAACDKLLQAQMQEFMDQQTLEALAAQVCGEVKKFLLTKPPRLSQDAMGMAGSASSDSTADALQKAAVISSNKLNTVLPKQHYVLSLRLSGRCEELPGGQLIGSFTSVFINRDSRAGRQSDTDGQGQVMTCQPAEFQYLTAQAGCPAGIRYYLLWLCAAAEPGLQLITFISDIFAGNLLTAVTVLQQRWEELVEDLKAGQLLPARRHEVPAAVADLVDSYLAAAAPAAMAAEAERLQQLMCPYTAPDSKSIASSNLQTAETSPCGASAVNSLSSCESTQQPALLQQLLPNVQAVFVITTGSHSKFCSALQQLLGSTTAIVTPFYGATEGLYGYNVQLLCPGPWVPLTDPAQQQFALLPDTTCFFEFLPTDDDADNNGSDADVVVVEQGQWASSASAKVGDIIQVHGFMPYDLQTMMMAASNSPADQVDFVPVISFIRRAGVALNLVWEKYDEGQLLKAVRETVAAISDVAESSGTSFPGLAEIMPATITLVEYGSFAALKEATVAAKGISPSQFKMPTVIKTNSKQMQHFENRRLPVPSIVCVRQ
eukprot:gene12813-12941_t